MPIQPSDGVCQLETTDMVLRWYISPHPFALSTSSTRFTLCRLSARFCLSNGVNAVGNEPFIPVHLSRTTNLVLHRGDTHLSAIQRTVIGLLNRKAVLKNG